VTRILLVDDHPLIREGVAAVLADEPEFQVVGEAANGEQAVRQAALLCPDIVILDVRMPGSEGLSVCANLVKRHPGMRVLILTSSSDEVTMMAAFGAGARGFVVKESDPRALRSAVRFVAQGGTFVDPRLAGRLVSMAASRSAAKGPYGLSQQEMRVLRYLPLGYSNREIAEELGISEETVKTHVRNTLRKLGVSDRARAAALAQREGLL
jgi:two-component system, NarL family, response regulator DevR